jgi:hypothetical protein
MEVEQPHPPPVRDSWDGLLHRIKKQKTEEAMNISSLECWNRDWLAEVARSPSIPKGEIKEARAEIIWMINAELWSSEPGERLKQDRTSGAMGAATSQPARLKRSPQDCQGDFGECLKTFTLSSGMYSCVLFRIFEVSLKEVFGGDLPDIRGKVEVFGVEVSKSFVPDMYRQTFSMSGPGRRFRQSFARVGPMIPSMRAQKILRLIHESSGRRTMPWTVCTKACCTLRR